MKMIMTNDFEVLSFNTASGMDCMQCRTGADEADP